MATISTGTSSSSPRITSSTGTTASTTTPSVLALHQSAHHQPALHHLQHHLQHLHQPPGVNPVEGTTTTTDGHHHHHQHQAHLQQQQQQQQQHQHQQVGQHPHQLGLPTGSAGSEMHYPSYIHPGYDPGSYYSGGPGSGLDYGGGVLGAPLQPTDYKSGSSVVSSARYHPYGGGSSGSSN
uniref:Uncharacterized protein n=1 Tax=Anopheles maculatus TaxID=74869 RepID=A0A182SPA0_9DIPT